MEGTPAVVSSPAKRELLALTHSRPLLGLRRRVLRPRISRVPDLPVRPSDPRARSRPARRGRLLGRRRPRGTEGLPPQGVDGVRLDLRARRVPGARLHGRLPPPVLGLGPRAAGGRSPTRRARRPSISSRATDYDSETGTLPLSAEQANAFEELNRHYEGFFREPTTRFGLRPEPIDSSEQVRELTAFFAWSSWAASARRPGHNFSYTNNWPPEPGVESEPTANVVVWSVVSLIALLGGSGSCSPSSVAGGSGGRDASRRS